MGIFNVTRSTLLVRHFSGVPVEAANIIANASPTYGSRARALQAAMMALVLQKKPTRLRYPKRKGGVTRVSYKLLPQTVELIDRYTPVFGTSGAVIGALSVVIKAIDKKMREK